MIENDQQQGPFTLEQLAEMNITPQIEVWTEGMADWRPASEVSELTEILQRQEFRQHMASTSATPPPYHSAVESSVVIPPSPVDVNAGMAYQQQTEAQVPPQGPPAAVPPQAVKPKKSHKWVWPVGILLVLVLVMALTCPSREDHKYAIKSVTHDWVSDKVDGLAGDALHDLMGNVGLGAVGDYLKELGVKFLNEQLNDFLDDYLEVDNYLVVSVGRYHLSDKRHTVSLGAFGHVFTFNTDDIDEVIFDKLGINTGAISGKESMDESDTSSSIFGSDENDDKFIQDEEPAEEPVPGEEAEEDAGDELMDALGELADSAVAQGSRQLEKTAKEWAQKQLEKHFK